MLIEKEYLGDAVYVEFDGYGVKLTTSDGVSDTNTIVMEDFVLEHFANWMERLKQAIESRRSESAVKDHTSDLEPVGEQSEL